jgi:hypothetical protein
LKKIPAKVFFVLTPRLAVLFDGKNLEIFKVKKTESFLKLIKNAKICSKALLKILYQRSAAIYIPN